MTIIGYNRPDENSEWTPCVSAQTDSDSIACSIISSLLDFDGDQIGMVKLGNHICLRDENDEYIIDGEHIDRYYDATEYIEWNWHLI